jgi:hypothetical protein
MLIESTVHLPISLAIFQDVFHAPDSAALMRILFRWLHFVAGITWIGLLYFFNLVNVPFQKNLDAETKKKVNPDLLSRTLWYFRWGANPEAGDGVCGRTRRTVSSRCWYCRKLDGGKTLTTASDAKLGPSCKINYSLRKPRQLIRSLVASTCRSQK